MQKLGHLVILLIVLTLGFGTSLHAFAAPSAMEAAGMADSHGAMADMAGASEACSTCPGEPGMMLDCLPTCMAIPALAPQETLRFFWSPARYDLPAEESFTGADRRPDPYPPRPNIFG